MEQEQVHRINMLRVWDRASAKDIVAAKASYPKYQALTTAIAAKYGFPARTGAAVFAALSPNNDYHGNLRDTDKLLAAAGAHQSLESFTVSTYGNNKRKAWDIAAGHEDPDHVIVAPKTRNFFHNILDPTDSRFVTIDGHMLNIYNGYRVPLQSRNPRARIAKVDNKLYGVIAGAVMDLALEKGVLPCEAQGVLWITWRRIHGIHSPKQHEFWDRAYHAANRGFLWS